MMWITNPVSAGIFFKKIFFFFLIFPPKGCAERMERNDKDSGEEKKRSVGLHSSRTLLEQ